MTNEDWRTLAAIATPSLVILGRLWSMLEHMKTGRAVKKTDRDIQQIKISLNGDLDRRIQGIVHKELNNTDMAKHKSSKHTTMADKVIIWPNPEAPHDTYYWLLPEDQWPSEDPAFTTNLDNAQRFSEDTVEAVVESINANNPSLQVYSGNPTSPPPPPPGL